MYGLMLDFSWHKCVILIIEYNLNSVVVMFNPKPLLIQYYLDPIARHAKLLVDRLKLMLYIAQHNPTWYCTQYDIRFGIHR